MFFPDQEAVPDQGLQERHPGPAGQVVVASAGRGERGRLAGLPQPADRQRRADRAERLERRGHLNGALAAAVTTRLFELGWIERGLRRRSVRITAAGAEGLAFTFGLDLS